MPKVFPCYSGTDRELVHKLAAFLERGAGVEVLLEEGEMPPGGDLIAKVEEGLAADVVLVLLSPEAVPPRWILERWKSVFWEQAAEMGTALATIQCRDAKFPDLLRRKNFFDLRQNRLAGFRAIKRWLMSLSPLPRKAPFAPARQASFQGRQAELETLCSLLADTPGMAVLADGAGAGKTALALEFARRYQEDFDAVFWLTCGSRGAAALAGDLAAQLGVRLDRDLESNLNELRRLCARYRCLLILDDAVAATAAVLAPRGRTSVLLITRQNDLAAALSATPVPLEFPFPEDLEKLADAIRNLDGPAQRLLSAMCACAPSGFPLDMAVRTADAEGDEAREIVAALVAQNALVPLDENGPRFLIPAFVRERAALRRDGPRWARYHALAIADLFGAQTADTPDLTAHWPDLQHAFAGALETDWPLASTLARRALTWARAEDRLAEAFEILQDWSRAAERNCDRRALEDCAWEQIWILEHWGRTREARELDNVRREQYADQLSFSFDQS
ncbi:MAG TPA: toll/interleukin-1 receptor domain-containing protein [Bryobacteraceae bacterium]|nr:toll/interleukin-1 receptor domain-containing protein [Bryobacteraceae bacterium]